MAYMTQTTLVLDLYATVGGYAYFDPDDDQQDRADKTLVRIPDAIWEDFGRPAQITVTIAPGDTLNPKPQS